MSEINILFVITIFWVHFLADFVLQTNKMAINKSTSSKWLGVHVLVYSAVLLIFGWKYALANGVAHFVVDFVTSRLTTYLWKKEERHLFFIVIGFDQALHLTCLIATYPLLSI
jgi:hypothetical protein